MRPLCIQTEICLDLLFSGSTHWRDPALDALQSCVFRCSLWGWWDSDYCFQFINPPNPEWTVKTAFLTSSRNLLPTPSQLPLSQLVMNLWEMGSLGPCLPPSQNQTPGGSPALTSELNSLPFFICSSHLVDHAPLRQEKYMFSKYVKRKKRKIGSWTLLVL